MMEDYICHKHVQAAPITAVDLANCTVSWEDSSGKVHTHKDTRFFMAGARDSHFPRIGDVIVAYDDGYVSWSPKAVFDAGYTKMVS